MPLPPAKLLAPITLALAVALLALACSSRVPAPATPTPAPTPVRTPPHGVPLKATVAALPPQTVAPIAAATTPQLPPGLVQQLALGDQIDLPDGVSVIIDAGCFHAPFDAARQACAVAPADCRASCLSLPGLTRLYRDRAGTIRHDVLLSIDSLHALTGDRNSSVAAMIISPEGGELVVAAYLSGSENGPRVSLWRSTDGGVTWQQAGKPPPGSMLFGRLTDGRLLITPATYGGGAPDGLLSFPDLQRLADFPLNVPRLPSGLLSTWRADGAKLVPVPGPADIDVSALFPGRRGGITITSAVSASDGTKIASVDGGIGDPGHYLVVATPDGRPLRTYRAPILLTSTVAEVTPGQFYAGVSGLVPGRIEGNAGALIDVQANVIRPVEWPVDAGASSADNIPLAVQRGPFARVVNTGSCLNVREAPSADAHATGCFADGVLLHGTGETKADAGGTTWVHVQGPGGNEGWASAQYLER